MDAMILKLVLSLLTGMSGTFLNSSVVVVYFGLCRRMNDWYSYNAILLLIGLVNLFYQWCLMLDNIFKHYEIYEVFDQKLCLFIFSLQFTLVGVSLWNTTWLSMFYCARLVNSSHWLFVQIREKFLTFLPQLMAGSVLWTVVITMPLFWTGRIEIYQNQTDSLDICRYNMSIYHVLLGPTLGFCISIPVTCLSIGLSLMTLVRHIYRMRKSHIMSPQLQGHFQAISVMIIRVLSEITFFAIIVIATFTSLSSNTIMNNIYWVNILVYPTSQALILIFGNPQLKKKLCYCLPL
ncbi:hypothetical protein PRIEUP_LOCUS1521, partial [Pristimantis euphronides]